VLSGLGSEYSHIQDFLPACCCYDVHLLYLCFEKSENQQIKSVWPIKRGIHSEV